MSVKVYKDLEQGSDEWLEARRGIVTASVVGQLVTTRRPSAGTYDCPECGAAAFSSCVSRARKEPTPIKTWHDARTAAAATGDQPDIIEPADGDEVRNLTLLLASERIAGWVEPVYVNWNMERGQRDEPLARDRYAETYGKGHTVTGSLPQSPPTPGFIVRSEDDWTLGYSPDGLVDEDGLLEIKSRAPKKQVSTVLEDEVPAENMGQIQAGLLVTGRAWCDYVSFAGGLVLYRKRVYPDQRWFDAITAACKQFETSAAQIVAAYEKATEGLPMTERVVELEMF